MATETINYGFNKDTGTDYYDITKTNDNMDLIDSAIKEVDDKATASKFQVAGGTATVITLTDLTLADGNSKTFIVAANNGSTATTINGKPLYKPNTTEAPKLTAGKAVTVWYSALNTCFYILSDEDADTVDGKHASDFMNTNYTIVHSLSLADYISNWISTSEINATQIIRASAIQDIPPGNGYTVDNDFFVQMFKIADEWWRAIVYDIRSNKVFLYQRMFAAAAFWSQLATVSDTVANATAVGGVTVDRLVRRYLLDSINIDTTTGCWVTNISNDLHGTAPYTEWWVVVQSESDHFFMQTATRSSGNTDTYVRTKYMSESAWGVWRPVATGYYVQSTAPASPIAGSMWFW